MSASLFIDIEMPYQTSFMWNDVNVKRVVCYPDNPGLLVTEIEDILDEGTYEIIETANSARLTATLSDYGDPYNDIIDKLTKANVKDADILPRAPFPTASTQITFEVLY